MLQERGQNENVEIAEALEKELSREIEQMKKNGKRKLKIDEEMKANEEAVTQKLKKKERLHKLLEQAQRQALRSDQQLEELRSERRKLDQKQKRLSDQIVRSALKRHIDDSRKEGPSSKRPNC